MKITNWFGLFPIEQLKIFKKKRRKVEKINKSNKNTLEYKDSYNKDTYNSMDNYNEKSKKDWK